MTSSKAYFFKKWVAKYEDGVFTTDGRVVNCQACQQKVHCSKNSHLEQHSQTTKHLKNRERFLASKQKQPFINLQPFDKFSEELCSMFIAANIPLEKVNNSACKAFLEKYCGRSIPVANTLRKNYLKGCYEKTIAKIKEEIGPTGYIWCSVDETTDRNGRFIANLIVGLLGDRWHPLI
uniref:BED-type domain-containing protein n=1 Tax=Meloidogyne hapla TaxID=6305 RepID=A0A1I8C023_MELHA